MEIYLQRLAEIDVCFHETLAHLRVQQQLAADMNGGEDISRAFLSNSLRLFARLEDQRNDAFDALSEQVLARCDLKNAG